YAQRKAELIEAARIRRQLALEQALAEKRAAEQTAIAQLYQDEQLKFAEQNQLLAQLNMQLEAEVQHYVERYQKNPEHSVDFAKRSILMKDDTFSSKLGSVRLHLELEEETVIEQTFNALREQMHAAAQEELDYIVESRQAE